MKFAIMKFALGKNSLYATLKKVKGLEEGVEALHWRCDSCQWELVELRGRQWEEGKFPVIHVPCFCGVVLWMGGSSVVFLIFD